MFLQGPYFSAEGALGLPKAKFRWEHCIWELILSLIKATLIIFYHPHDYVYMIVYMYVPACMKELP